MSCNMSSVWPLADGRRDSGHINTRVTAQRVGLCTYGGIPKPGSSNFGRSGNLAETR